jgi:succinylglutamate desuccinylase
MRIIEFGKDGPIVGIITVVHGNEQIGKELLAILEHTPPSGVRIRGILANEEAMHRNVRFIDSDLNRIFPGKESGDREERLAHRLVQEMKRCEYVLDIHSTYADTEDLVIMTKDGSQELAKKVPIRRMVMMDPKIANGKSLIDHAKFGISLEFSRKQDLENAERVVRKTLSNISKGISDQMQKDTYLVYGSLKKDGEPMNMQNFRLVAKGDVFLRSGNSEIRSEESFYPVLLGEKAYDFICFKARKI